MLQKSTFFIMILFPITISILVFTMPILIMVFDELFPIVISSFLIALVTLYKKKYMLGVFFLTIPIFFYKTHEAYKLYDHVPVQISVTYPPISFASDPIGGCNFGVFRLSKSAINEINLKKDIFFELATNTRWTELPKYKKWHKTPIPKSWFRQSGWINCYDIDEILHQNIFEIMAKNGSFYTTTENEFERLIIIPSLEIAIYSYGE